MNSWPIRSPVSLGSIDRYGHRSLPQMQARVTRRRASVGSMRPGSATFSIRMSPAPWMTVALIRGTEAVGDSLCLSLLIQVPAGPLSLVGAELPSSRGRQERDPRVPDLEASEDRARAGGSAHLRG